MSGVGKAIGGIVGTAIAPGVGTIIGSSIGGIFDSAANKDKGGGAQSAPEAPKPVEQYETQHDAVRSRNEANRRRSSFANTFVASRGMGTSGVGKNFLGQ